MASTNDGHPETSTPASSSRGGVPPGAAHPAEQAPPQNQPPSLNNSQAPPPAPPAPAPAASSTRRWLLLAGLVVGLVVLGFLLTPWVVTSLNTESTDDAYVNSHVTFVAPRVGGQVIEVLVDDNQRVKKGDILVKLDKEPYQVQVNIKKSALVKAEAQAYGLVAQTRSNRFKLTRAIEDVNNQIANLRSLVAALNGRRTSLELARANLKRGEELAPKGGISKEDLDQRRQSAKFEESAVEQALQAVYAARAGLGLPVLPPKGFWGHSRLAEVPADLDQNFSTVREALANSLQSAAQLGYYPVSWDRTPNQAVADFYKQDTQGNLTRIFEHLIREAPSVKQAQDDLAQAELNLRYCDIVSDIAGQVTRRNVNPGNYVQVGQNLMAVRSLTEIWIDANFKETQLRDLRIGQRAKIEVDMYGSRHEYEGRITGFTMGTGQTLALLPPQNATGNFVKIVQRLPVRIELTDYNPEKSPLFVGLSVTPYVYFKEPAKGPHAGEFLQPFRQLPQGTLK